MPGTKDATQTGFTAAERAAMKERARELKASAKGAEAEKAVLETLAAMPDDDRELGERIHAIVKEAAPDLAARTWYGMPAYTRDGKVVCFFKARSKFDGRFAQLGFEDPARLDDGDMWPTVFAITRLTPDVEHRIRDLVARA